MSKGQKITVGCLTTLIVLILAGYFTLNWAKNQIISMVAEEARKTVVTEIENSPLPDDQKEAFLSAADEILSKVSSGEIEFTLSAEFADKPKAAKIISDALKEAINKLNIEDDQKKSINSQIERFATAYGESKISDAEVQTISDKLVNGQFGVMMTIWAAEMSYIHPSGLSEQEKKKAHITLGRLMKGRKSGKITDEQLDKLMDPYSSVNKKGDKAIKENLTDKEIRGFLTSTEKLLSENNVSEEPLKLDIGRELKEALDDAGLPE